MVLDPGCAGFPGKHDDREEDCRPEEWHNERGVASESDEVQEPRRQITSFLGLSNERRDITDRDAGRARSPERDLGI